MNRARTSLGLVTALATAGVVSPLAGYADDGNGDFGKQQELLLRAQSERFFGFGRPTSTIAI